MKSRLIALAAAVSVSLAGAASPAQNLFNEVANLLQTRYGGLSTVNRADLIARFQQKLNEACAPQGDACPTSVAYPILDQTMRELGDAHSFFYGAEAYRDFQLRQTGGSRLQYGIKLRDLEGGDQVITGVIPGSASADAGLKRGDRLVGLNGQKYTYDALRASRTTGEPITLDVKRGDQALKVTMAARESSTLDLPTLEFVNDVAVLRIPTFVAANKVATTVHDLIRQVNQRGASGMIIDLRDDPGGSLWECDMVTSAFVPAFTRVARHGTGDEPTNVVPGAYDRGRYRDRIIANPAQWKGPLAVLVNKGSASCSEFLAHEVQFAKRGVIIGEPTAGVSNTATNIIPLSSDGGRTAIQLTTIHYAKPGGTPYPHRITPDVAAADDFELLARGVDAMLQKGIDALQSVASTQQR